MFPHKILSGGQTGADPAALDVALEVGIPIGAYLPRGRKDENGDVLPDKYANMQETNTTACERSSHCGTN
ncbi:MAG: YpsA SLOG family protein [Thermoguttaceae bacterium]